MFCAGTGLAPFRGFVQHRAEILAASATTTTSSSSSSSSSAKDQTAKSTVLAPALLFFGNRSSHTDRLYAAEIDKWVKDGVVDVRYAFSQEPEHELAKGCKYVQERMVRDKMDLYELWGRGARVYVCGSKGFARGVGEAAGDLRRERREEVGKGAVVEKGRGGDEEGWGGRVVSDIFG